MTSITEPAAADMTYAFGLFYGGFVQLLAGMWEMYKVSAAYQPVLGSARERSGQPLFPHQVHLMLTSACTLK